jgi:branched-chain amino acid transport system substrate-binding protein
MKTMRRIAASIACAAAAVCGVASAADDVLRIGVLAPYSGPTALIGASMEKGARVVFEPLEKTGLGGRQVKFFMYDTEGNAAKAVQLYRRLVESDEVDVVVGPLTSGEGLAVVPVANQMKVPTIVQGAAEAMTKPVTPYVFALAPVDGVVTEKLLTVMKERKHTRAALIYSLDGFGQSGGKLLQEKASAFGIDLVSVETFTPQDTNMTPQLLRMREKNPQAIILWSASNPAPTITMKLARELGITAPIYLSYGASYNAYIEQAGAAGEGAFITNLPLLAPGLLPATDGRKSVLLDFDKAYRARWGVAPESSAAGPLDAKLIIEEALKKVQGPITRDKLRAAIETVKMCGGYGCRQITATDHRGNDKEAIVMMQVRGGKWQAPQN